MKKLVIVLFAIMTCSAFCGLTQEQKKKVDELIKLCQNTYVKYRLNFVSNNDSVCYRLMQENGNYVLKCFEIKRITCLYKAIPSQETIDAFKAYDKAIKVSNWSKNTILVYKDKLQMVEYHQNNAQPQSADIVGNIETKSVDDELLDIENEIKKQIDFCKTVKSNVASLNDAAIKTLENVNWQKP